MDFTTDEIIRMILERSSSRFGSRPAPSEEAVMRSEGRAIGVLRERGDLDNYELEWRFEELETILWEAGFFKVLRHYNNIIRYLQESHLEHHIGYNTYDRNVSYQCGRDFCNRVLHFLNTSTHVQAYRNFFNPQNLAVFQENPELLDGVISRDKTKLNTTCAFYIYRAECFVKITLFHVNQSEAPLIDFGEPKIFDCLLDVPWLETLQVSFRSRWQL